MAESDCDVFASAVMDNRAINYRELHSVSKSTAQDATVSEPNGSAFPVHMMRGYSGSGAVPHATLLHGHDPRVVAGSVEAAGSRCDSGLNLADARVPQSINIAVVTPQTTRHFVALPQSRQNI